MKELEEKIMQGQAALKRFHKDSGLCFITVIVQPVSDNVVIFKTVACGLPPLMVSQVAYEMMVAALDRIDPDESEDARLHYDNMRVASEALLNGLDLGVTTEHAMQ